MTTGSPGTVDGVLGPVPASELGVTHVHEHVLVDTRNLEDRDGSAVLEPLALHNYFDARHFDDRADTLVLDSVSDAIYELRRFASAGGGTIVDVTPECLRRNPAGLAEVARATGVNVLMGCGHYVHEWHAPHVCASPVEVLAEVMVRDCLEGVEAPRPDDARSPQAPIRAGVIGEIGLSWPHFDCEEKVLAAASMAQRDTAKALVIHPGRHPSAPVAAIRIVEESGGDPARVVMSHIDRTVEDLGTICELARTGCFVSFDLFGHESSYYPYSDMTMPNDGGRLRLIRGLFDEGFGGQLLVAHDTYNKVHTSRYGGEGYAHILLRVVPVMERYGLDDAAQRQLLVTNPAVALAGASV